MSRGQVDLWSLVLTPTFFIALVLVIFLGGMLAKIYLLGSDRRLDMDVFSADGALDVDDAYLLPPDMNFAKDSTGIAQGLYLFFEQGKVVASESSPDKGRYFYFTGDNRYEFNGVRVSGSYTMVRDGNVVEVRQLGPVSLRLPFCERGSARITRAKLVGRDVDGLRSLLQGLRQQVWGDSGAWVGVARSPVNVIRVKALRDVESARLGCWVQQSLLRSLPDVKVALVPASPFGVGLESEMAGSPAVLVEVPVGLQDRAVALAIVGGLDAYAPR
ncbi:hypothetical protein HY489_04220 [Candidatus Woesearchaeota archaeon]|nr:hypothetical protein [Candidatus Woesearchaeota archaeon]